MALQAGVFQGKTGLHVGHSAHSLQGHGLKADGSSYSTCTVFSILLLLALGTGKVEAKRRPNAPGAEARKVLIEARKSMEEKDYERARESLLRYIGQNPNAPHVLIYFALGNAWYLEGRIRQAFNAYESACRLERSFAPLCSNFAKEDG